MLAEKREKEAERGKGREKTKVKKQNRIERTRFLMICFGENVVDELYAFSAGVEN